MARRWTIVLFFLALAGWAAKSDNASDAKTSIANASKALGADNLKTIEYSGSGLDYVLGQAPRPDAPWPKFNDKTYTRLIDFDAPASRVQRVRTQGENPPHGGGQQPIVGEQRQDQVVPSGSPLAVTLPDDLMMSVPYGFLRVASSAKDATVKSQNKGGKKYTVISFTALNKAPVHGYLNDQNVLERVETTIDNTVLGDIPFETTFADYK